MSISAHEIDFLPVGEKSISGDAILFRYIEDGVQRIILIDGGFEDTFGTINTHIQNYYRHNDILPSKIDHIVCSHPDRDHIGSIIQIIDTYDVGTLWINDPRKFKHIDSFPIDGGQDSFSKGNVEAVAKLSDFAKSLGIEIKSPYQGEHIGPFVVCSPTMEFYKTLVTGKFERLGGIYSKFKNRARDSDGMNLHVIDACWGEDVLYEFPATSVSNESSTVLFAEIQNPNSRILLTADAGTEALTRAVMYLETDCSFIAGSLNFIQIPHHGSRHNVNSETLDSLLGGKILPNSEQLGKTAFVSVAKHADKYPKKSVTNAFINRGYVCAATRGDHKSYPVNMRSRPGWEPIDYINYSETVEELDQ